MILADAIEERLFPPTRLAGDAAAGGTPHNQRGPNVSGPPRRRCCVSPTVPPRSVAGRWPR
jgi:hypothetical protein